MKNCRRYFLHKLSKKLSEGYNIVVVEDLNIKKHWKRNVEILGNKKTG
nr:hypothetical protein [uncultured Leptotrichia sp.]